MFLSLPRFVLLNVGRVPHIFYAPRFLRARQFDFTKAKEMLLSAEQWRKDFKVDEIVKFVLICRVFLLVRLFNATHRNFEFTEKEEVDKYYPQYYHKMDKVRPLLLCYSLNTCLLNYSGRSSDLH